VLARHNRFVDMQRRLECAKVTQTACSAVTLDQQTMKEQCVGSGDVLGHFASRSDAVLQSQPISTRSGHYLTGLSASRFHNSQERSTGILSSHYFPSLRGIQVIDISTEGNRLDLKPGIQRQIDAATDDHRQGRPDNDRAMAAHQYRVLIGQLRSERASERLIANQEVADAGGFANLEDRNAGGNEGG
jgi:hypothetical protein